MEHGLELIIPRLEIFGNWIFNIFPYPGNIGNRVFLIAWYPGNIGNRNFPSFWSPGNIGNWSFSDCLVSWKYGRRAGGGGRAAPGVVLCCLGLFLEHVPGKMNMVTLELRSKQALFWKWLPRPNHYAHKICIEILCRTPVSILKYLSPRPQNHMKNSKYSFLAWMSTWISREALRSTAVVRRASCVVLGLRLAFRME